MLKDFVRKLGARSNTDKVRMGYPFLQLVLGDCSLKMCDVGVASLFKMCNDVLMNALKEQTGLSNKKWDKAIKGLTKNKLAKVEKTYKGLVVSVV